MRGCAASFRRWRAMEGRFNAEVTHRRQTMEPVGPLSLARWHTRPIIGTDRPTKGFQTAPKPCWAKRSQHLCVASRSCSPAASNFRSRKSARAAQECTALIAAITAVTAMVVSLSNSTRRDRAHHHDRRDMWTGKGLNRNPWQRAGKARRWKMLSSGRW